MYPGSYTRSAMVYPAQLYAHPQGGPQAPPPPPPMQQQQLYSTDVDIIEVFDPDFKFIYDVPSSAVVHLPPARLNITRLVLCRNYRPYDPQSCAMGGNCKFVHADCDFTKLEAHPIHVNYIWRHESLCMYPRLPAGDVLTVWAPNNKQPATLIPSECVLVTRGSQAYMSCLRSARSGLAGASQREHTAPLSHCAHYYFNRMCNRGECCNFIHAVHVDPNVQGDFKRAPGRGQHHHHPQPSLFGGGGGGGDGKSGKASGRGGARGGVGGGGHGRRRPLLPVAETSSSGRRVAVHDVAADNAENSCNAFHSSRHRDGNASSSLTSPLPPTPPVAAAAGAATSRIEPAQSTETGINVAPATRDTASPAQGSPQEHAQQPPQAQLAFSPHGCRLSLSLPNYGYGGGITDSDAMNVSRTSNSGLGGASNSNIAAASASMVNVIPRTRRRRDAGPQAAIFSLQPFSVRPNASGLTTAVLHEKSSSATSVQSPSMMASTGNSSIVLRSSQGHAASSNSPSSTLLFPNSAAAAANAPHANTTSGDGVESAASLAASPVLSGRGRGGDAITPTELTPTLLTGAVSLRGGGGATSVVGVPPPPPASSSSPRFATLLTGESEDLMEVEAEAQSTASHTSQSNSRHQHPYGNANENNNIINISTSVGDSSSDAGRNPQESPTSQSRQNRFRHDPYVASNAQHRYSSTGSKTRKSDNT